MALMLPSAMNTKSVMFRIKRFIVSLYLTLEGTQKALLSINIATIKCEVVDRSIDI
ncbi:hypothetical protein VCRA2126O84_70140 [Vibrio crassostreae]|nr:hypothetical protein VCRA2126O84_70140 [Vibrio crassostreae]